MKKLITILRSYLSLYCLLLLAAGASAQVHITSHIVPPYLNRVADYASHPELMLVTLTNLSNAEVQVQLTAKITGDNGISAWVKPGYRSPRAIAIQPGQSVNLNGNDVAFLFDISNIEYTGISRSDMTRGLGLLEGNYILCIRALQYNTLEPLSSDEPVGCTMFRISDLEPPRILTPFDEQQVDTKGVQVLPIVWTTPAGSSPNTEYTLKIVEMVVPGNPNEALQTTRPIFQETVHSNMLVYGPSHPALIQGRRYAMVVQAVDPLGQSNFRNRGISEVVSFSYDAGGFVATEEGKVPVENKDEEAIDKKMATHLIRGKLLWTFKQSEEQFNKKSTFTVGNARDAIVAGIGTSATAVLAEGAVRSSANQSVQLVNTSPVTHYLSHSPLQLIRPTTVALVDPTLSARAAIVVSQGAPNIQPQTQDAASIISTSGAHGLSFTYENVKVAEGVDKHPLANAIITIKGVGDVLGSQKQSVPTLGVKAVTTRAQDIQFAGLRTTSSLKTMLQQEPATVGFSYLLNTKNNNTLASFNKFNEAEQNTTTVANVTANGTILASARTDGEGNFSMQMLDPRYEGQQHYNYLLLAVQQDGFEPFELRLDMDKLDSLSVLDLGEQLLLAKTYRFSPTVNVDVDKDSELSNPGMRVIVYRAESELRANPYLTYEGNLEAAMRKAKIIQGKVYYPVAADSVPAASSKATSFTFSFSRLFYTGSLYVEMEPYSKNIESRTTSLRIEDMKLQSSQILVALPSYFTSLSKPFVSGEVILKAGENMVPVEGAILSVTYRDEDKLNVGFNLGGSLFLGNLTQQTAQVKGLQSVLSNAGQINHATAVQSGANPLLVSAALAGNGVSKPVMVQGVAGTQLAASSGFAYNSSVVFADEYLSPEQLQKKYGTHTVRTDSTGQYYIGNLPVLKDDATYTVKIISLPYKYRDMEVTPGKEQNFVAAKGQNETRSFTISPELFNLVGRVIDDDKKGIANARLHFKGGSTYFETGATGLFQTSYFMGEHTLIVEKEGYLPLEIPVRLFDKPEKLGDDRLESLLEKNVLLTKVNPGDPVLAISKVGLWEQSLQQTNTVKNAVQAGQVFSPALFGNAAGVKGGILQQVQGVGGLRSGPADDREDDLPMQLFQTSPFTMQLETSFHMNDLVFAGTSSVDLGDIGPMMPRVGKVRFTVVEKSNGQPIAGASVQLFDSLSTTDGQGEWLYEGFGGVATVLVKAPTGKALIPVQKSIQIDETGKITEVRVELEAGIRVYGKVSANGSGLAEARLSIEGRTYLGTATDDTGMYELFLPKGEQALRVSKSAYFSKKENLQLIEGIERRLDFVLEDGGGKNIGSLLGFAIELDRVEPDGAGEKWTGRFVDLKGIAPFFSAGGNYTLPFSGVQVTFDGEGNALPKNGEVKTDVTSLALKAFGFLPVTLLADGPLRVTKDEQGKGRVAGKLQLDVGQIQGTRGFSFPTNEPLYLHLQDAVSVAEVAVFSAQGGTMADMRMRLSKAGAGDVTLDLYGFSLRLDLGASSVGATGLDLVGEINTPALGPVGAANIKVELFQISKELRIQQVKINQQNLPSITIGGWKAKLSAVLFNENGFKLGGELTFSLPQSGESSLVFSNLSFAKDAIFGGQFSFPSTGINVYKIVNLTTGGKALSFGRVGNTQVYYLSGSASMKFDKLITKAISIPSFQVQTDGRFLLEAPVNYTADLTFAKFKINSLTLSTLSGQAPFVSVQGEFKAEFPGLKFEGSDIRFKADASGGVGFSVGTIKGELSVAVMKVGVTVGLTSEGFEGGGKLVIPGTPINAEMTFHYFKKPAGIDIGATFVSNISIPIGIVEITRVGGGFRYNTENKKFMININGGATITGMRALVELNPISLTVESGPIITGQVGVVVGTAFRLVDAYVILNFPSKFFSIEVKSNIEPVKGVAKASINGLLRIKWAPGESYVFLGANTEVNVLGFFKSYGEYALGVNIDNPKYRNDDIAGYFKYLDADLYAEGQDYKFSGVYLHAMTEIGVPKERAKGINLKIVSGKAWFYSTSDVMLLLNFARNDYRFKLAGSLSAGAEGCIGPGCIGAGFSACYALMGGYSDSDGWFLGGKAAGSFQGHIGCSASCNSLGWWGPVPCGGRVCVAAHAYINIRTRKGVDFGVGLGDSNDGNYCAN